MKVAWGLLDLKMLNRVPYCRTPQTLHQAIVPCQALRWDVVVGLLGGPKVGLRWAYALSTEFHGTLFGKHSPLGLKSKTFNTHHNLGQPLLQMSLAREHLAGLGRK